MRREDNCSAPFRFISQDVPLFSNCAFYRRGSGLAFELLVVFVGVDVFLKYVLSAGKNFPRKSDLSVQFAAGYGSSTLGAMHAGRGEPRSPACLAGPTDNAPPRGRPP